MTTTNIAIIILFVIAGIITYIAICMFFEVAICDVDTHYSKRIAKCINKGNLYKAVRLYKKHNPAFFFTKYVKEYATDNFEGFVRTLYTYVKNEKSTANVVGEESLVNFVGDITGKDVWKLYRRDEDFHTYLQKKIDIMKNSDDALDNEKWCAESDNILMCLFILALENTGFLKIKDGKRIDFRNLAAHKYDGCGQPHYKELYNIMDDCETRDIITKVLNYSEK